MDSRIVRLDEIREYIHEADRIEEVEIIPSTIRMAKSLTPTSYERVIVETIIESPRSIQN